MVHEHVPLVTPKEYNEPWMNDKIMKLWRKLSIMAGKYLIKEIQIKDGVSLKKRETN